MFGEVFLAVIHVGLDCVTAWLPASGTDCGKTQEGTREATVPYSKQGSSEKRSKIRGAEEKAQSQVAQAQDHTTCGQKLPRPGVRFWLTFLFLFGPFRPIFSTQPHPYLTLRDYG